MSGDCEAFPIYNMHDAHHIFCVLHDTAAILSKGFVLDEPFVTCAKSCDLFSKPSTWKKGQKKDQTNEET